MPDSRTIAQQLCVRAAGRRALRLAAGDGPLRVIARFERSAYLGDARGGLACIGADGLGLGPLNALVARAEFERARLAVGDRVALDASGATVWRPQGFAAPAGDGLRRAIATLDAALARVPPRGLSDVRATDAVNVRARPALATLTAWIAAGNDDVPDEIASLIGLGPGLTPAGDDALGGAMIALRALGRGDMAERLASSVLPLARTQTSAISFAHLEAAANGEGAEALHDTLAALVTADGNAAVAALRRLDRLGHSSGWDALAGVVACVEGLRAT